MPPIVDIYCRVAVDDANTEARLDEQEQACRRYCEQVGLIVGEVFQEVAPGTQYQERSHLTGLRRRYLRGESQGVVVSSPDRLSRSHVHLAILVHEMGTHGVTFYCVDEFTNHTATDKLVPMLVEFLHEVRRQQARDPLY